MSRNIKLLINCVIVAALTAGGAMLTTYLPMDLLVFLQNHEFLNFAGQQAVSTVYRVLVYGIVGALVALLMLILKPRKILLYAFVSAATFAAIFGSWEIILSGNLYHVSLEITWILTVPCLYWIFALVSEHRQSQSHERDA